MISVDESDGTLMIDASRRSAFELSDFITTCQRVSSKTEFRADVYPRLSRILPHAMFACIMVRVDDMRILETMNLTFPPDYLREVTDRDTTTCPAIRKWTQTRAPVFIDDKSAASPPHTESWLEKFRHYQIGNVAVHGVMNLSQEHACCFSFGGMESWSKWEVFLMQAIVPHLHYALTNVEDFGNKRSRKMLTQREQEVLEWVCSGKSNAEIACILGISPWTVKIHVGNLLMKLNASTRSHAVAKAIAFGLVEV